MCHHSFSQTTMSMRVPNCNYGFIKKDMEAKNLAWPHNSCLLYLKNERLMGGGVKHFTFTKLFLCFFK